MHGLRHRHQRIPRERMWNKTVRPKKVQRKMLWSDQGKFMMFIKDTVQQDKERRQVSERFYAQPGCPDKGH